MGNSTAHGVRRDAMDGATDGALHGARRDAARGPVRGVAAAVAVLAAFVLVGCTSPARDADAGKPSRKADAEAGAKAGTAGRTAAGVGSVGAAGSACPMPLSFDLAASWKPKAAHVDKDSELGAALGVQGGATLICEIDAKPAGNIGFLRVWRGEKSDATPRRALERFTAAEEGAEKFVYTEVRAGDLPAVEVAYTAHSELLDESKKERAFAVATPDGPVVVHLGGMDTREHEQMLPAYELAKKTVRLG
ncbi:lipoprotein [Streptomyces sp. NPDC015144]|uniref:lipoprotein n=1 Tax=Streptomyces sp. NPDC015144 TaxID=3364944 RepID=UPI0036F57C93